MSEWTIHEFIFESHHHYIQKSRTLRRQAFLRPRPTIEHPIRTFRAEFNIRNAPSIRASPSTTSSARQSEAIAVRGEASARVFRIEIKKISRAFGDMQRIILRWNVAVKGLLLVILPRLPCGWSSYFWARFVERPSLNFFSFWFGLGRNRARKTHGLLRRKLLSWIVYSVFSYW